MPTTETLPVVLAMPRRAYSYLRVSDPTQVKGDGLRRQDDFALTICREEGWSLDDSLRFHDKGRSAFRRKNSKVGDLHRFLECVETGRVRPGEILIIENIDRLSREEVDDAYDLFRRIIKAGVWIATKEPRRVYNRETSGTMLNLLEPLFIMARAHDESKMKSVRVSAAWESRRKEAREAGRPIGAYGPAWLEFRGGGYVVRQAAAAAIREIFRLAVAGNSPGRIVEAFHAAGRPPITEGGWKREYVRRIIRRRVVLGEYQPQLRNGDGRGAGRPAHPGLLPSRHRRINLVAGPGRHAEAERSHRPAQWRGAEPLHRTGIRGRDGLPPQPGGEVRGRQDLQLPLVGPGARPGMWLPP